MAVKPCTLPTPEWLRSRKYHPDGDRVYTDDEIAMLEDFRPHLNAVKSVDQRRDMGRELLNTIWQDDETFISKQHVISTKKPGVVTPLRWNYVQRGLNSIIDKRHEEGLPARVITLKARQQGASTNIQSRHYRWCDANPNRNAFTISYDDESTTELFQKAHKVHNSLWFPQKTERQRGTKIELQNGSVFLTATAGNLDAGRSMTIHHLHISELPMWPNATEVLDGLLQALSDEAETTAVIESTAKGTGNEFYSMWTQAENGESEWYPYFAPWYWDPTYTRLLTKVQAREFERTLGRDDQRYMETYELSVEQMAWRAEIIRTKLRGSERRFRQEYPACVTADTLVSTDAGVRPIGAGRGGAWRCDWGEISNWGKTRTQAEIVEVRTQGGRRLRCTPDHQIHTEDGFVEAKDLKEHRIELSPPIFTKKNQSAEAMISPSVSTKWEIDEQAGRFLGIFMGDGSWYKGAIEIACDAKDEDFIVMTGELMQQFVSENVEARVIKRVKGRKGSVNLRAHNMGLQPLYKEMGLVTTAPSGSRLRREVGVPEVIWRSPRNVVREFLKGLFETDGSASSGRIRWGSSKFRFAKEVQMLLLMFEINARITPRTKKGGSGHDYVFWELTMPARAADIFVRDIGFLSERKYDLSQGHTLRPLGRDGRASAHEMWDPVVGVEGAGCEDVFDLTVPSTARFGANGLVVHNCPEEAFLSSGSPAFNQAAIRDLEENRRNPQWVGNILFREVG